VTPAEFGAAVDAATAEDPLILTLDTNAVFDRKLVYLAEAVNRSRCSEAVKLRLNPLVFVERNCHERRYWHERGETFEPHIVRNYLQSVGVEVPAFDLDTADRASATLVEWHPTKDQWTAAKWARVCELYGVASDEKEAPSRQISATVDWFIAATVERSVVLVTDDKGTEFSKVERRVTYKTARETFVSRREPSP
jgi:hypothetical protein